MEPYTFEARLARRLLAWGFASIAGGAALAVVGQAADRPVLRAFGSQTIGWGVIDAGLALGGRARAARRLATPGDPGDAAREAVRARRLLQLNAILDAGYVVVGMAVAAGRGRTDPAARGHGRAAVVQGAFLLAFDAWHAARVPAARADCVAADEA
jgi:hypothetical protein